MKILTKDDFVDFEAPIHMTGEQTKKLIKFMKEEFNINKKEEITEKTRQHSERENTSRDWVPEEFLLLLSPISNDEVAIKTERSIMSVKMKRGYFVSDFMIWAKSKGYSLPVELSAVKEFLKDTKK